MVIQHHHIIVRIMPGVWGRDYKQFPVIKNFTTSTMKTLLDVQDCQCIIGLHAYVIYLYILHLQNLSIFRYQKNLLFCRTLAQNIDNELHRSAAFRWI